MSQTRTASATYTTTDVENVVRRVKADLIMIADSSGGWTPQKAAEYAHDIEELAKAGYLAWVDVTLLSSEVEVKAARFHVDTDAGTLVTSRPGGVLWPRMPSPRLRIVIGYTADYTGPAREQMKRKLNINWTTNHEEIGHGALSSSGGRDYVSSNYGVQRKDWAA
jgi:hypothetical protein